ncbi:IS481 family transposase [Caulobacter sp. FWC26]|uniref:IS481 family transposase n=2 Tax=unclassified Caulobacter TaxID=2648921 RepID=UPI000C152828|nr:IS481 family transposase [Caulobacter sp. FWC26]AZS23570.1 IS481 family transposase [Caulobacter sp. FWC26]
MNIHQNARLTPLGRAAMISRIEVEGWSVARAAEAFGISRQTVGKWLQRHRRGGERRLHDRSSAPRRCPRRTSAEIVDQVQTLRRQRMTGPAIARNLSLARSTVGLILRRLGLGKLSALEPRPPIVRYERAAPGEMIHLDIKKLGRFTVEGHRVTGDRRAGRSKKAGWDFLHVCVDDASRLAYTEILPSEGQHDTTAFLERALAWLSRHGVAVQRVMTDNGSAYRSKLFAQALRIAGARHVRTKPYTPRTNGKAERFIQTSLREWAYGRPYACSEERSNAIKPWTDAYNLTRPHSGIGGLTPWQRVNNLLGNDI